MLGRELVGETLELRPGAGRALKPPSERSRAGRIDGRNAESRRQPAGEIRDHERPADAAARRRDRDHPRRTARRPRQRRDNEGSERGGLARRRDRRRVIPESRSECALRLAGHRDARDRGFESGGGETCRGVAEIHEHEVGPARFAGLEPERGSRVTQRGAATDRGARTHTPTRISAPSGAAARAAAHRPARWRSRSRPLRRARERCRGRRPP